jgi:hypothetical protein
MTLYQAVDDGEPQPRSRARAGAMEAFDDLATLGGGYAGALVVDDQREVRV